MITLDYKNDDTIMVTISLVEYRSLLIENAELQTNILNFQNDCERLAQDREEWKKMYFNKCDEIKELKNE